MFPLVQLWYGLHPPSHSLPTSPSSPLSPRVLSCLPPRVHSSLLLLCPRPLKLPTAPSCRTCASIHFMVTARDPRMHMSLRVPAPSLAHAPRAVLLSGATQLLPLILGGVCLGLPHPLHRWLASLQQSLGRFQHNPLCLAMAHLNSRYLTVLHTSHLLRLYPRIRNQWDSKVWIPC
jgi:hypothetical protein